MSSKKNSSEEDASSPAVEVKDVTNDDIPWRVYLAHSLSTWGDNMWWFAGGVFMLHLQNQDLRLTAIYGLVIAASVIVFGASLGRWIDRTQRLFAAKTFLVIQNTCVTGCALVLSGFIGYRDHSDHDGDIHYGWTILVSVSAIVLASVARLASSGINIIIQKDWIVIIANNDNDKLARMNSILRTIELTTYMLAPAAGGFLFTYIGDVGTGIFIAVWNIVSVCLEFTLLTLIYKKHPKLAEARAVEVEESQEEDDDKDRDVIKDTINGWKTYLKHPVRNAGLGLACLYMTVLGFDNITYGYCLLQGVPHFALGILVGISALVGVMGSLAYPVIRGRVGIERSGLIGMFLLISTSSLAVISVFLPGSPMTVSWWQMSSDSNSSLTEDLLDSESSSLTFSEFIANYCSVSVFLMGIILARFGLWIVDLTITQILQENVEEHVRGTVNGVQDSLNNTFDLIKCILVIFLPDKETFAFLIFFSYTSINLGWFLYSLYSHKQRGHLFHFSKIVKLLLPSCMKPKHRDQSQESGTEEEKNIFVKKLEV